jgi:hypothetical protein
LWRTEQGESVRKRIQEELGTDHRGPQRRRGQNKIRCARDLLEEMPGRDKRERAGRAEDFRHPPTPGPSQASERKREGWRLLEGGPEAVQTWEALGQVEAFLSKALPSERPLCRHTRPG